MARRSSPRGSRFSGNRFSQLLRDIGRRAWRAPLSLRRLAPRFFRPVVQELEARRMLATAIWDGGGSDNKFSTAANWENDTRPTTDDDVEIPAIGQHTEVVFDSTAPTSNVAFNKFFSDLPFRVTGGTLRLGDGDPETTGEGPYSFNNTLIVTGGTITGTGVITVLGAMTWNGGTITDSDVDNIDFNVNGGLTLGVVASGSRTLNGRALNLDSNTTWSASDLTLSEGAALNNAAGREFVINAAASVRLIDGTSPSGQGEHFTNNGTLRNSANPFTTTRISTRFTNGATGVVDVPTGTLYVDSSNGFSNYDAAAKKLTGGTYTMTGIFKINAPTPAITSNAAEIVFQVEGASFQDQAGGNALSSLALNEATGKLTFENSANLSVNALTNAGEVTIGDNSFLFTNTYTQTGGSTVLTAPGGVLFGSPIALQGGSLSGIGAAGPSLINNALISPGLSPGKLRLESTYDQEATGSLEIEIGGLSAGAQHDQLVVNNNSVTLAGALNVSLAGNFVPAVGNTFLILDKHDTFGSDLISGIFDGLPENATFNVGATTFRISYVGGSGNDVVLTVVPAVAGPPTISISDVAETEGDDGTTDFTFTVTLNQTSSETVTVNYATADGTAKGLVVNQLVGSLSRPVFLTMPAGDMNRLFILEQHTGNIRIFDRTAPGTLLGTPFLTIPGGVSTGNEEGLLGLAFHPNYAANGFFYVNYTDGAGDIQISRFTRSAGNANLADAGSVAPILTIAHPGQSNHNGGWLGFGPDGFLYVATGDGGSANDPPNNSQNLSSLLGKMLRLNVDADDFPVDPASNYAIPASNPFAGAVAGADEIWAYGLRNPYRASFDQDTGDLWIGDVGQNAFEEIDFQSAGSTGGENYGWRAREGKSDNPNVADAAPPGAIDPVYDYVHGNLPTSFQGRAVAGGYVYRGPIQELVGNYFFGDNVSEGIWSIRSTGNPVTSATDWTGLFNPSATNRVIDSISSFGEDPAGNLFIVDLTGEIYAVTNGGDYDPTSGQLTFLPDELSKTVTVKVIGDLLDEPHETFQVNLSGATNATIADSSGLGTIDNDDATISIAPAGVPLDMVSWYRAEGNANDSVDGNNGTVVNGPSFTTGQFGQAFSFSGSNYVSVPDADNLDLTGPLSIEGWVFLTENNFNNGLVFKGSLAGSQGVYSLGFFTGGSNQLMFRLNGTTFGPGAVTGNTSLELGQWYHVAAVYDGAVQSIYLNGVLDGSAPYALPVGTNLDPLIIGGYFSTGNLFKGNIDEVQIFNRALSPAEIQLTFQNGRLIEGNNSFFDVFYDVTLANPSSETVTTEIVALSLMATEDEDFEFLGPTTLTFTPGQTSKQVGVRIFGDTTNEPDEQFQLELQNLQNAAPGVTQATTTIANDDVGPVVNAGANQAVPEGDTVTLEATFTDPGTDGVFTAYIDWGDGQVDAATVDNVVNTLTGSHVYGDNGVFTATVGIFGTDGTQGSDTVVVTVNNVAPGVTAGANRTVNEGAETDFQDIVSFVDPGFDNLNNPGPEKDETFTITIDWGDGTPLDGGGLGILMGSPGVLTIGTASGEHTYADNGVYTVTVTIFDDDGGSDDATFEVTVNNVAPTLTVPANQVINEVQLLSVVNIGVVTDPGFDNPLNPEVEKHETFTFSIDWGDSSPPDTGNATIDDVGGPVDLTEASFDGSHAYADNGVFTVTVTVLDDDGGSDIETFQVTVNNVAPTADAGGPYEVNEGGTVQLSGTATDPAGILDPLVFEWDLDNDMTFGEIGAGAGRGDETGQTPTFSAAGLDGPGTFPVRLRISDGDDGVDVELVQLSLVNVAPSANPGGPYQVDEGGTVQLNGSATDPGEINDPLIFDWDLDNDGIFGETGGAAERGNETGQSPTFSATGLDGPGTSPVSLRVRDGDGGIDIELVQLSLVNVPPQLVDAGGPYSVNSGATVQLAGTATDPAGPLDPLTFTWDLDGDGTFGETGEGATRGDETTATPTFNAAGLPVGPVIVSLRVSDGDNGVGTDTATINVIGATPSVTLGLTNSPLAENGGVATVTATLSAVSSLDVTVTLDFTGTATNLSDYTRSATSIVILAGAISGSITLTGVQDALDETDETIIVGVDAVANGTESGTQQITATITDDDPPPGVTLALSGSPLAENAGVATVTATLSAASSFDVTVVLGFTGSSANPADYTASTTQIVIPAGSTTGSVTLTGVDDALDEAAETIIVDITSVTNGTEAGTQQVTATITDDDSPPSVTLALSGSPLAENGGVATVTATLSAASSFDVTVVLGFTGSATNPADYTTSATQLVIPAGSTTGSVTLTGVDDALDEAAGTIIVDITSVTNGVEAGTQQVTATITDDDPLPSVTLAADDANIAEAGGVATFTATLSAVSGLPVTVDLGFTGTATFSSDYTRSGIQILIPAGSTTGTVIVTAVQDTLDESDETLIGDITGVSNGTENGTQQQITTIADDDPPPSVTLAVDNANVAEAAGVATFTATLSALSGLPVTVDLGFTGTATLTSDYTRSGVQIVIPAGSTTGIVTVTAVQDALDEDNETVVVEITGVLNGTENGTQQETTTITDDDSPPSVTLSVDNDNIAEAGGVATFTASLSALSGSPITVDLGFTGTTALTNDYTRSGVQIVIPAGSLTVTVTVTAVQDTLDEDNETVIVDITGVANGTEGGVQQQTTTITDDDPPPTVTLSLTGSPLAENGGVATVTATLSTASSFDVTVVLGFTGSAANPADYTTSSTQIVIPAGSTTGSITLTGVDDALDEAAETISVDVTSVANGAESGTQQVTATITDDDPPPSVTLSLDPASIGEAGGTATITATLSAVSGLPVTVALAFAGTAALTNDYTRSGVQIVVPAGSTTGFVTITAVQDALDEDNETVIVEITGVTNGTENGTQQETATITDDDLPPSVTLSLSGSPLAENGGVATVTATLSAASSFDVTVALGFTGSAANPGGLHSVRHADRHPGWLDNGQRPRSPESTIRWTKSTKRSSSILRP